MKKREAFTKVWFIPWPRESNSYKHLWQDITFTSPRCAGRAHDWSFVPSRLDYREAACADLPADLRDAFFSPLPNQQIAAVQICWSCPLRERCLSENFDERHGVWGGITSQDRAVMRQRHRRAQQAQSARRALDREARRER